VLETLVCELGKETLDGVEPGGGCRGEVEDKPPMFLEPRHDVGMLQFGNPARFRLPPPKKCGTVLRVLDSLSTCSRSMYSKNERLVL